MEASASIHFPDSPELNLTLPVTLGRKAGLRTLPKLLRFGEVAAGQAVRRRVLVSSSDGKAFAIESAEASSLAFTAASAGGADAGKHWVEVTFRPERPGAYHADLTIATTHPGVARVTVALRGTCP